MNNNQQTTTTTESEDSFSHFFASMDDSAQSGRKIAGTVLKGVVVAINDNMVLVDVGLKAEGWVPLSEFRKDGASNAPAIGEEIDVFVERIEDKDGLAILSRERAWREEVWEDLERKQATAEKVMGEIQGRIRGGYTVDLKGAYAFLPGSHVDIRPVTDIAPLMAEPQEFQILKMNRVRGNIVVSRRSILEAKRNEQRGELFANLKQGQILEGVVKNITDYGAFVDLGGIDGLLHVTDMSWRRIGHPSEKVTVGDNVRVQIIRYNQENHRVSLGMKQLTPDPWEGVEHKYPVNAKFTGEVSNITDYGVFVILEEGVEGLIHISELSWSRKNVHPSKVAKVGDPIDFVIMEIDLQKRRISLGHKHCLPNPWETFAAEHKSGDRLTGTIRNIAEFGLFVSLDSDIEGMVHSSDVSWEKPKDGTWSNEFAKGQEIEVVLLEIDVRMGRVSLGIKQLQDDPIGEKLGAVKKGDVVTGMITQTSDAGLVVVVDDNVHGFIKRAELSRLRSDQRSDRFAVGEKIDAQVIGIDRRELSLSIKAREVAEMKSAVKTYGSTESGASLGDILSVALQEKELAIKKSTTGKKKTKADAKSSSKASASSDDSLETSATKEATDSKDSETKEANSSTDSDAKGASDAKVESKDTSSDKESDTPKTD